LAKKQFLNWSWAMKFSLPYQAALLMSAVIITTSSFGQEPRGRWSAIPGDSLAMVAIDLTAIRNQPELQLLPWEVFGVASREQLGVDLLEVTSVEISIGVPTLMPEVGAAIHSKQPVDIADLVIPELGQVEQSPKKRELRFRQFANLPVRVAQMDDSTMFVGTTNTLSKMMSGSAIESKAMEVAKESKDPLVIVLALEKVRTLILGALDGELGAQIPPELLAPLNTLAQETKVIRLTSSIGATSTLKLDLYGNSPDSMRSIASALEQLREVGIGLIEQQLRASLENAPEVSAEMKTAIQTYIERFKGVARGSHWTIENDKLHAEIQASGSMASIGVLTGLLLPAVQSAREAARRASSSNNLKQLVLALHNYNETHKRLPRRAICDADGTPLLSWRVAILPFIEQGQLYNEFHLDEPWDSEHNQQLLEKMPPIFASPRVANRPGHSNYIMPYGEDLPGSVQKLRFQDILDGTSNTIALVEVDTEYAVPWTAPEDLDLDEYDLPDAFPQNGQGTNVALYDGSVRFISQFIDLEVLSALLTHAGGEVINAGF
jgi:Protein of unknown function (DUF1559)